jgi:hypothetical protein
VDIVVVLSLVQRMISNGPDHVDDPDEARDTEHA